MLHYRFAPNVNYSVSRLERLPKCSRGATQTVTLIVYVRTYPTVIFTINGSRTSAGVVPSVTNEYGGAPLIKSFCSRLSRSQLSEVEDGRSDYFSAARRCSACRRTSAALRDCLRASTAHTASFRHRSRSTSIGADWLANP